MFFEDNDRQILVGVNSNQVRGNNYFDGPFDQIPPRLQIKELLERVCPYVKYRGGIDAHGNFLKLAHTRVAISPYVKYSSTSEFLQYANRVLDPTLADDDLRFLELVKESKMEFHKRLDLRNEKTPENEDADLDSTKADEKRNEDEKS